MPITYASVPIGGRPAAELQARLDAWWHRHGIVEAEHPGYLTPHAAHLPVPYPPRRRPPELDCLVWPTGYSRWATFHTLVTGDQLDAIRAGPNVTLVIEDRAGGRVAADMPMLPTRPVCQKGRDELYLLSLVDDRYANWNGGSGNNDSGLADTTWAGILAGAFPALTIPTVPAAYLTPSYRWGGFSAAGGISPVTDWGVAGPLVRDALLRTVGFRYAPTPGPYDVANFRVRDYAAAAAADAAQWDRYRGEVYCGGRLALDECTRFAPGSVLAHPFDGYGTISGGPDLRFYPGPGGGHHLALAEYPAGPLWDGGPAKVVGDFSHTAADADQEGYAAQAATDYYHWFLSRTDATFRGVVPWEPTGLEDRVEWRVRPDGYTTTVHRTPFGDHTHYGRDLRLELSRLADTEPTVDGPTPAFSLMYLGDDRVWRRLLPSTTGTATRTLKQDTIAGVPAAPYWG